MRIAVIPARGGSKRIPKKNIRNFCGLPMIAHAIRTANESGLFDKIIVSTDCEEVSAIAKSYGAEVPFKRPEQLSGDDVGTTPVVAHAINEVAKLGWNIRQVCCLYATTPLLLPEDLRRGFNDFSSSNCLFSFAAAEHSGPVLRSFTLSDNRQPRMMFPQYELTRSQDLPKVYFDAGQFYWGFPSSFEGDGTAFTTKSVATLIPRLRVQDIDTEEDWILAEILYRRISDHHGKNASGL